MASCRHSKPGRTVLACSGASNVGQMTVEVAKRLDREGVGSFKCATSLGAHVSSRISSVKCSDKVLVIDGCTQGCAKRVVERAGIENYAYVIVSQSCCLERNSDYDTKEDDHVDCLVEHCKDLLQ